MSNIDIADVNPGDELTVKIGNPDEPESWATLTGKVHRDSLGYLELGTVPIRYPEGGILVGVREIVSHTPAKPDEPENIGTAVEDADGQVWVRALWGSGSGILAWRNTKPSDSGVRNFRRYDEINVVRVLHEGWSA